MRAKKKIQEVIKSKIWKCTKHCDDTYIFLKQKIHKIIAFYYKLELSQHLCLKSIYKAK